MGKEERLSVMPIITVDSVDEAPPLLHREAGLPARDGRRGEGRRARHRHGGAVGRAHHVRAAAAEDLGTAPSSEKRPVEIYVQVEDVERYHDQLKRCRHHHRLAPDDAVVGRPDLHHPGSLRVPALVLPAGRRTEAPARRQDRLIHGNPDDIGRLILIPSLITLGVTLLRLAGELTNGSPTLFSRAVGGGAALVGIIWLVPCSASTSRSA